MTRTNSATARSATRGAHDAWHDLPAEVERLERSLSGAHHALDAFDAMTESHRARVAEDASSLVPDAASAAARAGHADRALDLLADAAEHAPAWALTAWAEVGWRWWSMLDDCRAVILDARSHA